MQKVFGARESSADGFIFLRAVARGCADARRADSGSGAHVRSAAIDACSECNGRQLGESQTEERRITPHDAHRCRRIGRCRRRWSLRRFTRLAETDHQLGKHLGQTRACGARSIDRTLRSELARDANICSACRVAHHRNACLRIRIGVFSQTACGTVDETCDVEPSGNSKIDDRAAQ